MPSSVTTSEVQPRERVTVPTREEAVMKAHQQASQNFSSAYNNFYAANPPEIHQLTTAQRLAAKEYFTNPKFRHGKELSYNNLLDVDAARP